MKELLFIFPRPRRLRSFGFTVWVGKRSLYVWFSNFIPRFKYENKWQNYFMTNRKKWESMK